jgi:hypothetical protein
MTTLLTLDKEIKCVIPEDVKVIYAQLSKDKPTIIVDDKKMTDYCVFMDKMAYDIPLVLYKGDILELSKFLKFISKQYV